MKPRVVDNGKMSGGWQSPCGMPSHNAGTFGNENKWLMLASAMLLWLDLDPIVICGLVAVAMWVAHAYFGCSLVADLCCGSLGTVFDHKYFWRPGGILCGWLLPRSYKTSRC